jgi:1-acyl-sn-glycerol-3-phosphate acyltransferase
MAASGSLRPSAFYLGVGVLSYLPVRLLFRMRWHGREHLPREGGYVLAANHLSNLDPWAVGLPLFPRRFLRFMGKSELFWFPLGAFLRAGGAFPVRRGQGDVDAIEHAVELCRAGYVVVMFPEGTRRAKGLVKRRRPRPHTGAARIALDAGVPLVPAAVSGTDRLSRLGPIRVAYGPAVALDDLAGTDAQEAAHEATMRLMDRIHALEATL